MGGGSSPVIDALDTSPVENGRRKRDDFEMIRRCLEFFNELLHRPKRVFWICLGLGAMGIILDGTAFRLWSLHRDHHLISQRIENSISRAQQLEIKIREAQQPQFVERAVRDQFDLVKEGDLIFVFSEDGEAASE